MKSIILVLSFVIFETHNALAYESANTIYVKRETASKKPSLLDRKFVFRKVENHPVLTRETNLSALHPNQLSRKQVSPAEKESELRIKPSQEFNNWDHYAVEEFWSESQEVSAKLLRP